MAGQAGRAAPKKPICGEMPLVLAVSLGSLCDMRIASKLMLGLIVLSQPVCAQTGKSQTTDWGGGYLRGPDSASTTVATSGAGANKPAPLVIPTAPANVPMTDWGGGYWRGPDSASTTIATSGAGTPKPR
jgi:hypothetical protein